MGTAATDPTVDALEQDRVALLQYLTTAGEKGYAPDWYATIQIAQYLGKWPEEVVANLTLEWRHLVLEALSAERRAVVLRTRMDQASR